LVYDNARLLLGGQCVNGAVVVKGDGLGFVMEDGFAVKCLMQREEHGFGL